MHKLKTTLLKPMGFIITITMLLFPGIAQGQTAEPSPDFAAQTLVAENMVFSFEESLEDPTCSQEKQIGGIICFWCELPACGCPPRDGCPLYFSCSCSSI